MPYLMLCVPPGKSESEAQAILNYLRDHFPLKQSEGHVLQITPDYILFEQPEHTDVTLEQEVWLEKQGGRNFTHVYNSFMAAAILELEEISWPGE